jgi:protein-S-isoprenylcysteine O-methyltransferase Ste14
MTLLRHLLSILLLPTMVAGVVPQWILRSYAVHDTRWTAGAAQMIGRTLGAALIVAGVSLVAWCVVLFARVGRGTLAPWDPTKQLVAVGPYRYTRNPMITGVATTLVGEATFTGSSLLALWAMAFIVINHVYFLTSEEPGLESRFGRSYRDYKASVPRWIPNWRRRSVPLE